MKYCSHCGNELLDEAYICPKCGCKVSESAYKETNSLQTAAKIFMVLTCSVYGIISLIYFIVFFFTFVPVFLAYLLPLAWQIPMTVYYFKATNEHERVSTGFKVCTLLFVNLISGILMLCDNQ